MPGVFRGYKMGTLTMNWLSCLKRSSLIELKVIDIKSRTQRFYKKPAWKDFVNKKGKNLCRRLSTKTSGAFIFHRAPIFHRTQSGC